MSSPKLLKPRRFGDERGWFCETYNARKFAALGVTTSFCQDNHSLSRPVATLRGLHFQRPPHAQAKLVRCVRGAIWDVAVDIRGGSPTFGRWVAAELSADNGFQLFVPEGYAHGFVTLLADTEVEYKVSDFHAPECEGGVAWNDASLNLPWPLKKHSPVLSDRDARWPELGTFETPFNFDGAPLAPLDP